MRQNLVNLPADLLPYAYGEVHAEPEREGHSLRHIKTMRRIRQAFLRNLLQQDRKKAWQLPDFQRLMSSEIKTASKQTVLPVLFQEWDLVVSDLPVFFSWYEREYSALRHEYSQAVHSGLRPKKRQQYLHADAVRAAFFKSLVHGERLGELECGCLGHLVYGF